MPQQPANCNCMLTFILLKIKWAIHPNRKHYNFIIFEETVIKISKNYLYHQ